MSIWTSLWLAQGCKCARCGQPVPLVKTAKSSHSFDILCADCFSKPDYTFVVVDEASPTVSTAGGKEG